MQAHSAMPAARIMLDRRSMANRTASWQIGRRMEHRDALPVFFLAATIKRGLQTGHQAGGRGLRPQIAAQCVDHRPLMRITAHPRIEILAGGEIVAAAGGDMHLRMAHHTIRTGTGDGDMPFDGRQTSAPLGFTLLRRFTTTTPGSLSYSFVLSLSICGLSAFFAGLSTFFAGLPVLFAWGRALRAEAPAR